MGQKTNPNLFRLIINQKFLSNWCTEKKNYSNYLKEDNLYRKLITNIFEKTFKISKIKISRKEGLNTNFLYFELTLLYPREKEIITKIFKFFLDNNIGEEFKNKNNLDIKTLVSLVLDFLSKKFLNISNKLKTIKKNICFLKINYIYDFYTDSSIIAKNIADQIQKRVPYKRILKKIIENAKNNSIKGIMIQLSGCLDGVEIARTESKKYGSIPLHTLKANIDYAQDEVNTIYGIIGIKVWLYKN